MKNTLKKNIALACMLTVGLSAAAVGGSLMGVSANAANSTFTLFAGASIRNVRYGNCSGMETWCKHLGKRF